MAKKLIKKHDALSKKFLTDIEIAKSFLKLHLDPKVLAKCNIKSLVIEAGSYIDADLRKKFSDIVYKIDLKDKSGSIYVYVMVEHQSAAEKLMPLRILRYQLEIIQTHVDRYKVEDNLPLVVPLVFYNGTDSPYLHATDIKDLFADKELVDSVSLGNFNLIDLTVMPEHTILEHKQLALLEMVLKHIHERDFNKSIVQYILDAMLEAHKNNLSKTLFDSALSYLIYARESGDLQPLFNQLIKQIPEYKEDVMTYAEELRQEGIQQGRQQGRQEGMQQGMHEAIHQMVQEMLKAGAELSFIKKVSHLSKREIEEIQKSMH